MGLQTLALIVIAIIIAIVAMSWFTRRGKQKQTVISALIDIYTTGRHHVEFIPAEGTHPVDLIQLVISYASNIVMLTMPLEVELVGGIHQLLLLNQKHYDLANEAKYRQELTELVNTPQQSLLPSEKLAAGNVDRYQVRLIRGKERDYSITDFSAYSYKPNMANSLLYLYHAVVIGLDSDHLKLLHESLFALTTYFRDTKPTVLNNQAIAFAAVEYVLKVFPKPIKNSPGRISRKL